VVLPEEDGPEINTSGLLAVGDLPRDFRDVLLVQGFRNQNDLAAAARLDGVVECPDARNAQPVEPRAVLAECGEQLRIFNPPAQAWSECAGGDSGARSRRSSPRVQTTADNPVEGTMKP